MKNVITISREYCSGGRIIAKALAEKIGYDFYDTELLQIIANQQNLNIDFLAEVGEYKKSRFLPDINFVDPYSNTMSMADQVFLYQYKLIKELADKGKCVIVGKAADYILKDRQDKLSVFVYSDYEHKKERALSLGISESGLEKTLAKKDKSRANHYQYYTDRPWNDMKNYDICLDSGYLGYDECVRILEEIVK